MEEKRPKQITIDHLAMPTFLKVHLPLRPASSSISSLKKQKSLITGREPFQRQDACGSSYNSISFFFCYTTIIVLHISTILTVLLLLRLCSKEFNLAQEEIWSLPSAPRRQALSPWNVLPNESVFVYLGSWGMQTSLTVWFRMGALSCTVLAQYPEGLQTWGYRGQSTMRPSPSEKCEPPGSGDELWLAMLSTHCHTAQLRANTAFDPAGRGQREALHLELSWTQSHEALPSADFNVHIALVCNKP